MRFQKQAFRHDPDNGIIGDCHRTALAAILDLDRDRVPHFGEIYWNMPELFNKAFDDWLSGQGYAAVQNLFQGDLEDFLSFQQHINPNIYYLLGGMSASGVNHTVVCRGGSIVCDPAINDSGIVGPCDDGYYWVTYLTSINLTNIFG